MTTLKLSIVSAIIFHLIFWIIGIVNLNPQDYSSTRLVTDSNEQALINLIPLMMGVQVPIGYRIYKWITKWEEEE